MFDIGQVLIRYEPGPALASLARRVRSSPWKVRWVMGRAGIRGLSTGGTDPDRFVAEVNRRLGTDFSRQAFADLWGLDLPGPVDDMLELLERMMGVATVALLSDTNAFHWENMMRRFPVMAEIPEAILSFQEGLTKPDPRFYALATRRLRGKGTDGSGSISNFESEISGENEKKGESRRATIVYFDDLPKNVRAARAAGWDAHRFVDRRAAEAVLRDRGILP